MRQCEFNTDARLLLLLATVVLFLLQRSGAETRHDGDEVLEVTMEDGLSPLIDTMHELGPEVEIWRQLTTTSAHVYVPRPLTAAFRHRLDNIGATHRLLIADVQRLIDEERESNGINEAGKGSRGHRKRSIAHSQSASIVGMYPTYDQLIAWLTEMSQRYATFCTLHRVGQTVENRHIYVMKISADSAADARRPAIWIDAGIHAREWISVATAVYFIHLLLTSFSSHSGDWTTMRQLDWYIAPLLNPDGYAYAHHKDGDRFWRKNRMQYNDSISFSSRFNRTCIGVDLNRNFDFQWGTVLTNDDPCYIVYAGPWPSSELETQAIASFVLERKESLAAFLTMHNYGQMILSRWAYTDDLYPPDHNETVELMSNMVDAIYQTGGINYTIGTAPEVLYKFSGGAGDWARAVAGIKYSLEIELRDRGQLGFLLPANYTELVGDEMWSAVRVLATHIVATASYATDADNYRTRTTRTASAYRVTDAGSGLQAAFSVYAVIMLAVAIQRLRLFLR